MPWTLVRTIFCILLPPALFACQPETTFENAPQLSVHKAMLNQK